MVPASLRQPAGAHPRSGRVDLSLRRLRPANVSLAARAELKTLVVWSCVLGGAVVVLLLWHVWVRLQVVEAGYRMSATRQLVERLQVEAMELDVRVAAADSRENLERLARARLGMERPGQRQEARLP